MHASKIATCIWDSNHVKKVQTVNTKRILALCRTVSKVGKPSSKNILVTLLYLWNPKNIMIHFTISWCQLANVSCMEIIIRRPTAWLSDVGLMTNRRRIIRRGVLMTICEDAERQDASERSTSISNAKNTLVAEPLRVWGLIPPISFQPSMGSIGSYWIRLPRFLDEWEVTDQGFAFCEFLKNYYEVAHLRLKTTN